MFVRLVQMRLCDCCGGSAPAIVADYEEHINYCLQCWGEKMFREHPDFITKT